MRSVTLARHHDQRGFTLVEIAIVLVILGLLIGGIVKGQELINAARVRTLAETTANIQSAYYGFYDRYHRVPGDWNALSASDAIGATVSTGGNDNGVLDTSGPSDFIENNALWEQLTRAKFLHGNYVGGAAEPDTESARAPLNAYSRVILIGRIDSYLQAGGGTPTPRLATIFGRGVPVSVMRELDMKLDDGMPDTGRVRATVDDFTALNFFSGAHRWVASAPGCVTSGGDVIWDVAGDAQDCNALYLF